MLRGCFQPYIPKEFLFLLLCLLFSLPMAAEENLYLKAGIPSTDREWFSIDYEKAATLIVSGQVPLPRFQEPNGKKLLERVTSQENFSFFKNKNLSIRPRIESYMRLQGSVNTLCTHYIKIASSDSQRFPDEFIALSAFMLHLMPVGIDLMEEFKASLSKEELTEIRMEGLRKAYSGFTTILVGAETTLSESYYSKQNKSDLLAAMAVNIPNVKRILSPDFQTEFRLKLEKQKKNFRAKKDQQLLDEMIKVLSN